MKDNLAKERYSHNERSKRLIEKQVSIVVAIYKLLVSTFNSIDLLIVPPSFETAGIFEPKDERIKSYCNCYNDYTIFFDKNRIWLNSEFCNRIENMNNIIRRNLGTFLVAMKEDEVTYSDYQKLLDESKLPQLYDKIENEFRRLIGVN